MWWLKKPCGGYLLVACPASTTLPPDNITIFLIRSFKLLDFQPGFYRQNWPPLFWVDCNGNRYIQLITVVFPPGFKNPCRDGWITQSRRTWWWRHLLGFSLLYEALETIHSFPLHWKKHETINKIANLCPHGAYILAGEIRWYVLYMNVQN